jgi:guanylate kinase
MNKGKLLVFSAPSGSGKTTIVRHLLAQPELNLEFSISAATRELRGEEVDGKDYYFMSIAEFKKHIKAEDFIEWEEVYRDNFYGTLKSEVERIWAKGKNVIFDIDVSGGLRIKHKFPAETLAVFVKPPSVDELKRRLKERSTESEDKRELDRFCDALIEIFNEIKSIELGFADRKENLLKNAPHTQEVICADEWTKPYSRQQAAFPLPYVSGNKFWPSVSRVNNTYGDRNLICTCEPIESYQ